MQFVDKPVGGLPIAGDRLIPLPDSTKPSSSQVRTTACVVSNWNDESRRKRDGHS